jgi:hypothetical protein
VGFIPVIGSFPDGVVMSTTPVVSADRRYVRVGVDAQFTGLVGLTSVNFPAAAAAGGPGNGNLGGGFGGGLGGGGGAGGGRFAANGMNGPAPQLIAFQGMGSPEASAVLSGVADMRARPMLSASLPGSNERPKVVAKPVAKKARVATKKRR